MKRTYLLTTLAVLTFAGLQLNGKSPADEPAASHAIIYSPDAIQWKEGPPSLPPGARMATLEGDLTKEGPFVVRVKLPDGYHVPPHTHPRAERLTVVAGTFHIAMGEKLDRAAAQSMPAGAYGTWGAGMKHAVWAQGETIIQLHGIGPWGITYVNPADDPRNKK
jgi:quercetin dioxygenase-like cupin family protein